VALPASFMIHPVLTVWKDLSHSQIARCQPRINRIWPKNDLTCSFYRMTEALSNWEVMAAGSGSSLPNSRNSAFSFSRRFRAAFLLLCSFVMLKLRQRKLLDRRKNWE